MRTLSNNIEIAGIAAAVSKTWTPISSFQNFDDKMIIKFTKSTGVKGRYNSGARQTTSDLCFSAASKIIEAKNIDKHDIGAIVLVTQTPDYKSPASACVLHGRLGLDEECLAFDINQGCSGFTNALLIVGGLLRISENSNRPLALLLCGDTSAKGRIGYHDAQQSNAAKMLFGDCGTATLLRVVDKETSMKIITYNRGSGYKTIISPYMGFRHPITYDDGAGEDRMNDIEVFNFSTEEAPKVISEMMAWCNTTPSDYDCLVLHQANLMIMKRIAKLSGFKEEQMLVSIDEFGNTTSASIPVSFVKCYGEQEKNKLLRCMLCGYGVGLSWSAVDCFVNVKDILPLVHTDEYFDDGYYLEKEE